CTPNKPTSKIHLPLTPPSTPGRHPLKLLDRKQKSVSLREHDNPSKTWDATRSLRTPVPSRLLLARSPSLVVARNVKTPLKSRLVSTFRDEQTQISRGELFERVHGCPDIRIEEEHRHIVTSHLRAVRRKARIASRTRAALLGRACQDVQHGHFG
ncbi:uncharacterized protein B0I36DRAFT_397858, partial [Microdochium trichocladiopsis]